MTQVPEPFYYLIGFLILSNIGTIGSIVFAAARAVWWLSKLDARVEKNSQDINRAHSKIRDIDRDVRGLHAEVSRNNN